MKHNLFDWFLRMSPHLITLGRLVLVAVFVLQSAALPMFQPEPVYASALLQQPPPPDGGGAGVFDRLLAVFRGNTAMIVGFMVSAAVLLLTISIAKGGLAGQIFHLLGAPNAVSRAWLNVIEAAILVGVPLLTGVIVGIIVGLFTEDGAITIEIPDVNVIVR